MIEECFFCDGNGEGRSYRLDKREVNDGLMGDIFVCNECSKGLI